MKRLPSNEKNDSVSLSQLALPAGAEADWKTTIEELHTAEEELRQQNEALIAAAHELQTERQRYQELFNFAPDPYLETDPGGVIREANQAAAALLQVHPRFLAGKPLRVFVDPERRTGFDDILGRLRRGQRIGGEE